jgi:hypothetical protein
MIQTSRLGRLRYLWTRGWNEGMFAVAAVCGGVSLQALLPREPAWYALLAFTGFLSVVLLIRTFAVALARVDPTSVREDAVARLSPDIDVLLAHLGLNWEDSPVHEVDRLLQEGRQPEARRLYRSAAGVTWDEADWALESWPVPMVEAKVKLIRQRLLETSAADQAACVN